MKTQFKNAAFIAVSLSLAGLIGCGGGGGGSSPTDPNANMPGNITTTIPDTGTTTLPGSVTTTIPDAVTPSLPDPTTTAVTTTVIDGALKNATVCMDKNTNGACDAGEVQGKTDAAGNVTLAVPNGDVGKFPLLAMVGTDAVDVDHGTVTVPFSMVAPAANAAVISPLTTLVQETALSTGVTVAQAEQAVKSATGITVSLFQDFTKVPAPTDGSPSAKVVARMAVVTTQAQVTTLASASGTAAIDGAPITQADINRAINQRLLQILPSLVAAISNPANASLTGAAQEAAIVSAVSSSLLTTASMPTLVAINNQVTSAATSTPSTASITTATPTASVGLANLNFTDAANWLVRAFTGTAANNTPDTNGNIKFIDRRYRSNGAVVAAWNFAGNPQDQSILHWTGSAWEACGLNFESSATVRDAQGNSFSNYCNNYSTSKSTRSSFDIAGKTMAQVYDQARAAGFNNLFVANSATALGSATYPAGSTMGYQTSTPLAQAYAFYPGSSNVVFNYSTAVTAGGDGRTQAAGVGCNSAEFSVAATIQTSTLEGLVAAFKGTPCIFGNSPSFVFNNITYTSPDIANEAWGATTLGIGTIGNVGGAPTAFYTGNTRIRVGFTGSGTNPVTYYACKERFNNFSTRNCAAIGTGSYTINTLGDARVMTLNNPPAQAAAFNYTRTFVERAGKVYFGFQDKLTISQSARLNSTGSRALLAQLGLPAIDPDVPLALTAASYQGTWDARDPNVAGGGTTLFIAPNGNITCTETPTGLTQACNLTITNPVTGAISGTIDSSVIVGTSNFITGLGSGTYTMPAPGGNFISTRR
jgi:trimeric autotransporter adhesin